MAKNTPQLSERVIIDLHGHTVSRRHFDLAHAAGADAANRNMRAHGRKRWDETDWDLAVAEVDRILGNTVAPQASAEERRSA